MIQLVNKNLKVKPKLHTPSLKTKINNRAKKEKEVLWYRLLAILRTLETTRILTLKLYLEFKNSGKK